MFVFDDYSPAPVRAARSSIAVPKVRLIAMHLCRRLSVHHPVVVDQRHPPISLLQLKLTRHLVPSLRADKVYLLPAFWADHMRPIPVQHRHRRRERIHLFDFREPCITMLPKLALGKLTSSWMLIVVVFNLRVAIKTEGNAVLKAVVSPLGNRPNVMRLDPDATELVADATAASRSDKGQIDDIFWEAHRFEFFRPDPISTDSPRFPCVFRYWSCSVLTLPRRAGSIVPLATALLAYRLVLPNDHTIIPRHHHCHRTRRQLPAIPAYLSAHRITPFRFFSATMVRKSSALIGWLVSMLR